MLGLQLSGTLPSCSFFGTRPGRSEIEGMRKGAKTITMDVLKMLADLRHEREQIEEAILTLERCPRGGQAPRPSASMDGDSQTAGPSAGKQE